MYVLTPPSHWTAPEQLSYFADERALNLKGTIQLKDIYNVVIPGSEEARSMHTILVVTERRTYQFHAPSSASMVIWYKVLQAVAGQKAQAVGSSQA